MIYRTADHNNRHVVNSYVAFMMPPVGFEPTNSLRKTDLKSVAFDHSAKMAREGGPKQVRGLMV